MVERGLPEAAQEAIVVLSNADDRVISTSGAMMIDLRWFLRCCMWMLMGLTLM